MLSKNAFLNILSGINKIILKSIDLYNLIEFYKNIGLFQPIPCLK